MIPKIQRCSSPQNTPDIFIFFFTGERFQGKSVRKGVSEEMWRWRHREWNPISCLVMYAFEQQPLQGCKRPGKCCCRKCTASATRTPNKNSRKTTDWPEEDYSLFKNSRNLLLYHGKRAGLKESQRKFANLLHKRVANDQAPTKKMIPLRNEKR